MFSADAWLQHFNPRTRVGCDPGARRRVLRRSISIHAPGWGATAEVRRITTMNIFQSTHPGGVRRRRSHHEHHRHRYFNPRTRVGCDQPTAQFREINKISIHAPGWGATYRGSGLYGCAAYFNPRTRVGCDIIGKPTLTSVQDFNPRTRVGCDMDVRGEILPCILFQSTHPGGVRPRNIPNQTMTTAFQSTHPGGVRLYCSYTRLV